MTGNGAAWPDGYRLNRVAHIPLGTFAYAVTPEGKHLGPCESDQQARQRAIEHEGGAASAAVKRKA